MRGSEVIIRVIDRADSSDWERLREELWPAAPGDHETEISLFFSGERKDPAEVLIARDPSHEAVGFIELSIRPFAEGCRTDRVAYIEGLYVRPEYRKRGIASALIREAERWARENGCSEIATDTEIENDAAVELNKSLGYSEAGRLLCFMKRL